MPMYSLIEFSDSYSKKSRLLCQYHRDESIDAITDPK